MYKLTAKIGKILVSVCPMRYYSCTSMSKDLLCSLKHRDYRLHILHTNEQT